MSFSNLNAKFIFGLILFLGTFSPISGQVDTIEVFVIESFISADNQKILNLTFFTSELSTSEILFTDGTIIQLSDSLTDTHKKNINISGIPTDSNVLRFQIRVKAESGESFLSDILEVALPLEKVIESESNELTSCLYGGVVYLVPSLSYNFFSNEEKLGYGKELPIISFYSGGFNYPQSYFSLEYMHIPGSVIKNSLRVGYKYIFSIPLFEYVSPGFTGFSNFKGRNGIGIEATLGLFTYQQVFTFYFRGRFNSTLIRNGLEFTDFSIGLFSSFFSLQR